MSCIFFCFHSTPCVWAQKVITNNHIQSIRFSRNYPCGYAFFNKIIIIIIQSIRIFSNNNKKKRKRKRRGLSNDDRYLKEWSDPISETEDILFYDQSIHLCLCFSYCDLWFVKNFKQFLVMATLTMVQMNKSLSMIIFENFCFFNNPCCCFFNFSLNSPQTQNLRKQIMKSSLKMMTRKN